MQINNNNQEKYNATTLTMRYTLAKLATVATNSLKRMLGEALSVPFLICRRLYGFTFWRLSSTVEIGWFEYRQLVVASFSITFREEEAQLSVAKGTSRAHRLYRRGKWATMRATRVLLSATRSLPGGWKMSRPEAVATRKPKLGILYASGEDSSCARVAVTRRSSPAREAARRSDTRVPGRSLAASSRVIQPGYRDDWSRPCTCTTC